MVNAIKNNVDSENGISYIQDGLICWYDGIWNVKIGEHDDSSKVWKNLGSLGADFDAYTENGKFNSNSAKFSRIDSQRFTIKNYLMRDHMKGEWSYTAVFSPQSGWFNNYSGIVGNHGIGKGIVGGQFQSENNTIYFDLHSPSTDLYRTLPEDWNVGQLYTISQCASATLKNAKTYRNGSLVANVNNVDVLLAYNEQESFYIGAAHWLSDRVFDGNIFCFRVYNRQLSKDEVEFNEAIDRRRFGI